MYIVTILDDSESGGAAVMYQVVAQAIF